MGSEMKLFTREFPSPVRKALESARGWHAGQQRESDGGAFLEHPLEVARLLRDAGCSDTVIAAGMLHDVLEHTEVTAKELEGRFGAVIADLVVSVTEDEHVGGYRMRKRSLRTQIEDAAYDALLIFAADKLSNVRELARMAQRDPQRYGPDSADEEVRAQLEHYRCSVVLLVSAGGWHPLVTRLAAELHAYDRGVVPAAALPHGG